MNIAECVPRPPPYPASAQRKGGPPLLVRHPSSRSRLGRWPECDARPATGIRPSPPRGQFGRLQRAELTPTQEAEHLSRRKSIWSSIQADRRGKAEAERVADSEGGEQVEQVAPPVEVRKHGHAQTEGFAASTAAVTGKSKTAVNKAIRRAIEGCQEARDLIRGTASLKRKNAP